MVSCRFSRSMPPAKWIACVRRMASRHFLPGDIMYAQGSIGTSLVRVSIACVQMRHKPLGA